MSLLSETELAAIARNHARVSALPTQAETLDMFATGAQVETLTLCGETIATRPARAVSTDRQTALLFT